MTLRLCFAALTLAALSAACGSSSMTSATAPATVSRCGVGVTGGNVSIPAGGGSGRLTVTTARECAWTASPTAPWISIQAGGSGQGDGSIEYLAAANPDPVTRRAAVEVNDQRADIIQEAGACSFTLGSSASSFPPAGGAGTVEVRASSPQCTWTAIADADWVSIRSSSTGTGSGTVSFDVAAGAAAPRTATILVAGLRHAVTQTAGTCTFAVTPEAYSAGPSGGTTQIIVTAPAGCPWTAASNVSWASVAQGASGTGPGTVTLAIDATSGPSRSGSALIAGQTVALSQSAGCTIDVAPLAHTIGAGGGTLSSAVTAAPGCAWSATSPTLWIVLTGVTSGTGSGVVTFGVPPATGGERTGSLTIGGRQVTVTQAAGCSFAIAPGSAAVAAAGGTITVAVTAGSGCNWTASSSVSWIGVSAGASGSGDGSVTLAVAPSSGAARTATVTIAGQSFTVNQAGGCNVSLTPSSATLPAAGGTGSFDVAAGSGCAWTAATPDSWITVTSGATGSGNGTVQYTVAASAGATRNGTISVGGATFAVAQGAGCAYTLAPASASVPASGSTGSVAVTTAAGCAWSASSSAAWVTVTTGATGSGAGTVDYAVAANSGGGRTATLTIAGQTFTVSQAGGCSVGITPSSVSVPAAGGGGSVAVSAGAGCAWTAASTVSWITVTTGATGSGAGTVDYAVAANAGGSRSGTLTIGGQTFTVSQAGGCTIAVSPTGASLPAAGGSGTLAVTAGTGCPWTASSNASWIRVTSGAAGSGDGSVGYAVDPNAAGSRTGTLTVGGQTITIDQAAACTIGASPAIVSLPVIGGSATLAVTAGPGCAWTATPDAAWISIDSGASGSGDGTVAISAPGNAGTDRTGTVTIGSQVVTVTQAGLTCSYKAAPASRNEPAAGGTGTFNVSTGNFCPWVVTSTASWITVVGPAVRLGSGKVDYVVAPNTTGTDRTGTITLMGEVFTVVQSR